MHQSRGLVGVFPPLSLTLSLSLPLQVKPRKIPAKAIVLTALDVLTNLRKKSSIVNVKQGADFMRGTPFSPSVCVCVSLCQGVTLCVCVCGGGGGGGGGRGGGRDGVEGEGWRERERERERQGQGWQL